MRFVINILNPNGAIAKQLHTNVTPCQLLRYPTGPGEWGISLTFEEDGGYATNHGSWSLPEGGYCEFVDRKSDEFVLPKEQRPDTAVFDLAHNEIGMVFHRHRTGEWAGEEIEEPLCMW